MEAVSIDKALFLAVSNGDETAFRELFESYTPRLKAFFIKLTRNDQLARELVQEVFLNIWLYRSSLAEVEKPSSYIYRIASNTALAHFRKEDIQRQLVSALAGANQAAEPATLETLQVKELKEKLQVAIARLPLQQQQVFRLSREEGLSRSQIAARLGLAEKTVRNHLTLSLRSIQQFLADNEGLYIPLFLLQTIIAIQ